MINDELFFNLLIMKKRSVQKKSISFDGDALLLTYWSIENKIEVHIDVVF